MKSSIYLAAKVCILLGSTCLALAQGSLTPPGAPAPTMKTLQQIEPRTAITNSGAVTISQPGSYYLTTNISVATGDAITITTDNVTVDLNGFIISSTAPAPGSGTAILLGGGRRHVTILNGHIRGGVAYVGGVGDQFNGPGFLYGISWTITDPRNARVVDVSVSGCDQHGIHLGNDYSSVVERCTVRTVGASGIHAGSVSRSTVVECGGVGILAQNASDCYAASTVSYGLYVTTAANCMGTSVTGDGIYAYTAQNCYGASSGAGAGHGVNAITALNCWGSARGSGHGIIAVSANNCQGQASNGIGIRANNAVSCNGENTVGAGYGIYADYTALNCRGVSSQSGVGVHAETASNCYGESSSNIGVSALIAANCYGVSNTGTGLAATRANTSHGRSISGIGLSASFANFCSGSSLSVGTKYNMP